MAIFAIFVTQEALRQNELVIREEAPLMEPSLYQFVILSAYHSKYFIHDNAIILSVISWVAIGALIWKGPVRRSFQKYGFDYEIFQIMMKMRGSDTRMKVLNLLATPKNRMQISEELSLDWKGIDRHVKTLVRFQLLTEMVQVGNATYYVRSDKGTRFLETITKEKL